MPSSLDALEDVVRREYDAQERRADSLDTKAGLLLGFAGLLVSLTPETLWPPLALLARVFAGAAGVLALQAMAIPPAATTRLDAVLRQDITRTREQVLAAQVAAHGPLRLRVHANRRRVRAAVHLVTLSFVTICLATAIDVAGEAMP